MSVRAHLIYDTMADRDLEATLLEQAKQPDSPFEIVTTSPVTPTFTWQALARQALIGADVVIFLWGSNTDHPFGNFNTELELATTLGKPYILLAGRGEDSKRPTKADPNAPLVEWTPEALAGAFAAYV